MNLTNFRSTPLALVVELIRREAARYGTTIHHSELVGLIPQEALVDAAQWYLQLDQFESTQILERCLASAEHEAQVSESAATFLDDLAAGTPAPGGGSAAAYSGAVGAALVAMVARLTIGKKKYALVEAEMQSVLGRAETLRAALTLAVQEDAAAFEAVMQAFKLPKDTAEQQEIRDRAVEEATIEAGRVPLRVASQAVEVLELAAAVTARGNLNAISDGASGAAQARAALTAAGYNVRINMASLKDPASGQELLQTLHQLETRAGLIEQQIQAEMVNRAGLALE